MTTTKAGSIKQYVPNEFWKSSEANNLFAEISGYPLILHNPATGARSDGALGDPTSGTVGHIITNVNVRDGNKLKIYDASGNLTKEIAWATIGTGGGGAAVELLELKSQMEKQGLMFPISTTTGLNESFTDVSNLILTPRVAYTAGQTVMVLDHNKTDIDLMNVVTGWSGGKTTGTSATATYDTTQKIEGTGSIKLAIVAVSDMAWCIKDQSVFSLVDKVFKASFYLPSKPASLTHVGVKLSSTAVASANWKHYRIAAADLVVGWNHITVDTLIDTPYATNGTYIPSATIAVHFIAEFNSATTLDIWFDFIVMQPSFIIPMPHLNYIWDGTNQEELKISTCVGTGLHQRSSYNITALSNSYAVGSSYAKQRNVSIAGGQAIFPTGLTGVVAKTVYDITESWLPVSVVGKELQASLRFIDDEFKISSLPSTTQTKIASATDKSAFFKNGTKILIYDKRNDGIRNHSRYNSTVGANFRYIILSADATYTSGEITLTHTGYTNAGADTSYWYLQMYSVELGYAANGVGENNSLTFPVPSTVIPSYGGNGIIFEDNWNRADGALGNNWTITSTKYSGNVYEDLRISGNMIRDYAYDGGGLGPTQGESTAKRNLEGVYDKITTPIEISTDVIRYGSYDYTRIAHTIGGTGALVGNVGEGVATGVGFSIHMNSGVLSLCLVNNSAAVASFPVSISDSVWYKVRCIVGNGWSKAKIWTATADEPLAWNIKATFTPVYSGTYYTMTHYARAQSYGVNYTRWGSDNLKIKYANEGTIVRIAVPSLSCNRLKLASKFNRNDTTNQGAVCQQRDGLFQ